MMSNSLHFESGSWFSHTPPLLQFLAGIILVFLLALGADVLLQRVVELFLAGIMEQDAFAQSILELIKLLSFLAIGAGFAGTLIFFSIPFFGRSGSRPASRFESAQLLKTTLLSLRGIATVTFTFLVVTAIYELLLQMIGNQPPFFVLAALVIAVMYILILAYSLFDYTRELRAMSGGSREGSKRHEGRRKRIVNTSGEYQDGLSSANSSSELNSSDFSSIRGL